MHTAVQLVLAQPPPPPGPPLVGGIPNPAPAVPPVFRDQANLFIGILKWGVLALGVAGLLICAGMIVIGRRDRNRVAQQGLFDSIYVLLGLAMASMAATLVGMFAI